MLFKTLSQMKEALPEFFNKGTERFFETSGYSKVGDFVICHNHFTGSDHVSVPRFTVYEFKPTSNLDGFYAKHHKSFDTLEEAKGYVKEEV